MDRFVLGTAQLGMDYGVANKLGKPSMLKAEQLLLHAKQERLKYIDTAQGYGDAENVLGQVNEKLGFLNNFKIITKISKDSQSIETLIDQSLSNLKQKSLYLCLFHEESVLENWDKDFSSELMRIKDTAKVEDFGVSIYSPEFALKALEIDTISAIQVPFNILDHRLIKNNFFERARELSKQVYIRSIYLQGILLMNKSEVPSDLDFIMPYLDLMSELSSLTGLSKQEILFQYVKYKCPEAKMVLGLETLEQLLDNSRMMRASISNEILKVIDEKLPKLVPERVISPNLWSII